MNTGTPGELVIREAAFSHLDKYAELYNACFGTNVTEDYFSWKYFHNPAGLPIAFEAVDPACGTIAAFYAIMPELYTIGGKAEVVYQSFDTMTHPSYRGRGLFVKLAAATYQELKNRTGCIRLIGIPGSTSFPGFVGKLNWKNIHNISYLFLPRFIHRMKMLGKQRSQSLAYSFINTFGKEFESFFTTREPVMHAEKLLNTELLNWKIFGNRHSDLKAVAIKETGGKIKGFCIYKLEAQNRIFIYALETNTVLNEVIPSLINFLFDETGRTTIYTWEPTEPKLKKAYRQARFIKNPFSKGPFSYRVPVITRFDPAVVNDIKMYDIGNYRLQPIFQD